MILDTLANASRYYALHPRLEQAFALLLARDWTTAEAGTHELDGRDIFVNVMDVDLKRPSDAKLEIHDAYLDIQILVRGEREGFGWSPRAAVCKPLGAFDPEKDIQFFDDAHQTVYTLLPGQFTILLPEDAHAPMIGEGRVRKIIAKVRLG